jgi:glycosyltransferase involved in cell wall biosynthesis
MRIMTLFGFLSTYPPTRCGLATFTEALASAIATGDSDRCVVVRVDDGVPADAAVSSARLRVDDRMLQPGDPAGRATAAETLAVCDIVVVQHEYGIYGGADGDEVIDLLQRLHVPRVVVMHTVLPAPTAHQRRVTEQIIENSEIVVAMTSTAADLLSELYGVPEERLRLIPHGVEEWTAPLDVVHSERPVLLTWGLLGPGKGIEWVIRALATMNDLDPQPLYRVLGQTHPKVLLEIDARYQQPDELAREVAGADVVMLPYDSHDQATSGVLVEAVAAGRPVVATRFPHAIELLADGGGALVAHRSPDEVAAAVRMLLADPAHALADAELARSRPCSPR